MSYLLNYLITGVKQNQTNILFLVIFQDPAPLISTWIDNSINLDYPLDYFS